MASLWGNKQRHFVELATGSVLMTSIALFFCRVAKPCKAIQRFNKDLTRWSSFRNFLPNKPFEVASGASACRTNISDFQKTSSAEPSVLLVRTLQLPLPVHAALAARQNHVLASLFEESKLCQAVCVTASKPIITFELLNLLNTLNVAVAFCWIWVLNDVRLFSPDPKQQEHTRTTQPFNRAVNNHAECSLPERWIRWVENHRTSI